MSTLLKNLNLLFCVKVVIGLSIFVMREFYFESTLKTRLSNESHVEEMADGPNCRHPSKEQPLPPILRLRLQQQRQRLESFLLAMSPTHWFQTFGMLLLLVSHQVSIWPNVPLSFIFVFFLSIIIF